jgi:hypothetical protein
VCRTPDEFKEGCPFNRHKENEEARKKVGCLSPFINLFSCTSICFFFLICVYISPVSDLTGFGMLRGRRMKQRACTRSLSSHSRVKARPGQSLSEGVWLTRMPSWELILKVSDNGFIFHILFPWLPSQFVISVSILMDTCTISSIARINREAVLFIHWAMAGGKSKDGWSVPKKGSR